jgi:molybdopterin synthase sulfur carrier subunit
MIKILFFGALRERVQQDSLNLPLTTSCSVEELQHQLCFHSPAFAESFTSANLLCAVNQKLTKKDQMIQSGDEVAFFPPVTGG